MFGITNFPAVVVFGLLYGFWSGSCSSARYTLPVMSPKSRIRCLSHPFAISSTELTRWRAWVGKVVNCRVDAHIICVELEWGSPSQLLVYLCL
jgi:hypothetical protein